MKGYKISFLGIISILIFVVSISGCTNSGTNTSSAMATYNASGFSFQYSANDWTPDSNSSTSMVTLKTKKGGSDFITIEKFKDLTSEEAYGDGPMTAMQLAEDQVSNFPYIGTQTNNATNITYKYYSYSGSSGNTGNEQRMYIFTKNGTVYLIRGYFGLNSADSNIKAMNTILETMN